MWFHPIDPARNDGMRALLGERFEAYKTAVRTEFFEPHFASFSRQVMLVDVLGALVAGQAAFADTTYAIQAIAAALRYGDGGGVVPAAASWLLRGMGHVLPPVLGRVTDSAARHISDPRIDRVAFVATKADHVPVQSGHDPPRRRRHRRRHRRAGADLLALRQEALGAGQAGRGDPQPAEALPDACLPALVPLLDAAS